MTTAPLEPEREKKEKKERHQEQLYEARDRKGGVIIALTDDEREDYEKYKERATRDGLEHKEAKRLAIRRIKEARGSQHYWSDQFEMAKNKRNTSAIGTREDKTPKHPSTPERLNRSR